MAEPDADDSLWPRARQLYPALDGWAAQALRGPDIVHLQVPAGAVLFEEGTPCRGFPMVLRGEVRVAKNSASGRTLELYRVTPGDLCVVSTSCLFGTHPMSAQGLATQATELLLLQPKAFERWCAQEDFRRFVFGVFADRLSELMALAEAVAFQRLDQRLAAALLGRGSSIHTTHQQLADELGTVREIVTRLLRRFEHAGLVRCGREVVEVCDAAGLRTLACANPPS
jgi:CRP/FNR family transcriptional regulator